MALTRQEYDGGPQAPAFGPKRNPWVQDIAEEPTASIIGNAIDGRYELRLEPANVSHDKIRDLMRAKYGWRDVWVSTIFDTSNSKQIAVKRIQ